MAIDARLIRKEELALWETIKAAGFDPADFELKEIVRTEIDPSGVPNRRRHEYRVTSCVHTSSGSYFVVGVFWLVWSPDPDQRTNQTIKEVEWSLNRFAIQRWLAAIKFDLDNPSPWESLRSSKSLNEFLDTQTDDGPFTPHEQQVIAEATDTAKETASAVSNLPADHLKRIADSLDTLKASSASVTKKQFITLALGEAVKLMMQKINLDVIRSVWDTLLHGIAAIYGYIRLLSS
jgi:hypothetical protein